MGQGLTTLATVAALSLKLSRTPAFKPPGSVIKSVAVCALTVLTR